MDKVTRIGVSLEPDLLNRFDDMIVKKGYTTRSEAIRDMIRRSLVEESWKHEGLEIIGTITLAYDHHSGNVQEKLMEIQHDHHSDINSTIHLHLDEDKCLEVLLVRGYAEKVKALADELRSVRGVLHGKLTMTSLRQISEEKRALEEG
ncbi:MAG: nickel-responsive transcriptional regulator NikR [Methanomassiliicoccales archaeon]